MANKIVKDSILWTIFTTPLGHFECLITPFESKNASSIFQRKMDSIFNPLPFVCVYKDDILVHSKNHKGHMKHLKITLNKFI